MLKAQAYEANLYWRCPECGYEHNTMWFYEGNSSYKFNCGGCGKLVLVAPPKSESLELTPEGEISDECKHCCGQIGEMRVWNGHKFCSQCGRKLLLT